jgi:hypothetical protein
MAAATPAVNEPDAALHGALCRWLGIRSLSLAQRRGEALTGAERCLALHEDAVVLSLARLLYAHDVGLPGLTLAAVLRPSRASSENASMATSKDDVKPAPAGAVEGQEVDPNQAKPTVEQQREAGLSEADIQAGQGNAEGAQQPHQKPKQQNQNT